MILKYEGDVEKAQNELSKLIKKKTAEQAAERPQVAPEPAAAAKKGIAPLDGSAMQKKILEFTNLLRKSGIRVSVAEAIDAFNALDELSIDDREIFRDALRAAMVKRGDDIPAYDELFDLFWSGFYDNLRQAFDQTEGRSRRRWASTSSSCCAQIAEMMKEHGRRARSLRAREGAADAGPLPAREDDPRRPPKQAGAGRIENMLQVGFFSRRTIEQLGARGRGAGAARPRRRDCARWGWATRRSEQLRRADAQRCSRRCAARCANFTERELQQQNHDYMEKFRRETLLEKSFYHLTEDEIARMREVVDAPRAAHQEHPVDPQASG